MSDPFRSLLPPNSTKLERSLERAMARPDVLPVKIRDLWNPDTCPLHLLPWLAWAYGVTKWDSRWSEEQKRAVVRNALFIKRYKGTYAAVERALGSLGYSIKIVEWFADTPRADPATFRIEVSITDVGIDEPMYTEIESLINDAKNLRSHLTNIRLIARSNGVMSVGAAVIGGEVIKIFSAPESSITSGGAWIHTATVTTVHLITRPEA